MLPNTNVYLPKKNPPSIVLGANVTIPTTYAGGAKCKNPLVIQSGIVLMIALKLFGFCH